MASESPGAIHAVLFDLDGTLVDTAQDMVGVLQDLQRDHGDEPVSYELARSYVSNGAVGLLRLAFPNIDDDTCESLRIEYLDRYARCVCERSTLFEGLDRLLRELEIAQVPWGIVTNKPSRLTDALLAGLGLSERIACAVSGDTLERRKPHPEPLLHACRLIGIEPGQSLYAGDALRDIQAGKAAGMTTVAAAYGYVVDGDDPYAWGAHQLAASAEELTQIIRKAVNLDP